MHLFNVREGAINFNRCNKFCSNDISQLFFPRGDKSVIFFVFNSFFFYFQVRRIDNNTVITIRSGESASRCRYGKLNRRKK